MLALTHHTGATLAEVGFLLFVIAGVWLVAAQLPPVRFHTVRTIVAGGLRGWGCAVDRGAALGTFQLTVVATRSV